MKLCAATGCRTLIPNGDARCPKHDTSSIRRAAYRTGSYKRIRAWMLANATGCATCGATTDLTVDHIFPLSRGGTNDPLNLQVLCRSCNSRKNNRVLLPRTPGTSGFSDLNLPD